MTRPKQKDRPLDYEPNTWYVVHSETEMSMVHNEIMSQPIHKLEEAKALLKYLKIRSPHRTHRIIKMKEVSHEK